MEALRAKSFEPSPQLKQTIGKVEREIKRLADAGENSFRVDPPRELTRNLLYFVLLGWAIHAVVTAPRHAEPDDEGVWVPSVWPLANAQKP